MLCKMTLMSLTLLVSLTGARLDAPGTLKTFALSTGAFVDDSGNRYDPLIDTSPVLTEQLFAPRTTGQTTAGAPGLLPFEVSMTRHQGGQDRLAELDEYSFDNHLGEAFVVGTADPYQMTGTVSVSPGGTTVDGVGTLALSQLNAASAVEIAGEVHEVATVDADDGVAAFELATPHAAGATGLTVTVHPRYTIAEPRAVAKGRLKQTVRDEVRAVFQIQPQLIELDEPVVERYAGHGEAVYFKGTGSALSPVGMTFGPAGALTFGCRAYLFLEEAAAANMTLMTNGDISLLIDLGRPKAIVDTTTGTHTLTATDSIEIEGFSDVDVRYDPGATRLDLLVNGVQVASDLTVTGTPIQSGLRWRLGANQPAAAQFCTCVMGKWRWFGAYLSDDDAAEILPRPLSGAEDDLDTLVPGDVEFGTSLLLETADANTAAPLKFELSGTEGTDWARASFLEGPDQTPKPFSMGPTAHVLATNVDLVNSIMVVDGGPIEDIDTIYEDGVSTSPDQVPPIPGAFARGVTWNTYQEVLDNEPGLLSPLSGASLTFTNGSDLVTGTGTSFLSEVERGDRVKLDADGDYFTVHSVTSDTALFISVKYPETGGTGAGSRSRNLFDVWPQGGAFRLARFPAGEFAADIRGRGFGFRGFKFDGIDDETSFGTSDNAMFTSSFEIEFFIIFAGNIAEMVVLDSIDFTGLSRVAGLRISVEGFVSGARLRFQIRTNSGGRNVEFDDLEAGQAYHFRWVVDTSGGNINSELFKNLVSVDTVTPSVATLPISTEPLVLGFINGASPTQETRFAGAIFDLRFFSGNRSLADFRKQFLIDLPTNTTGLEHYYPSNRKSFPTATLVDEADGGSLDGTITGSPEYIGGPSPAWSLAQVEFLARALAGLGDAGVDLTEAAYAADTAAVNYYSATDDTTVRNALVEVRESVNLWDLITPEGVYKVGQISDPAAVTAVASFQAAELHIGESNPLPTEIRLAHSRLEFSGQLSASVGAKLRRLLSVPVQALSGLLHRNRRVLQAAGAPAPPEAVLSIPSRFAGKKIARPTLLEQKALHGVRRPPVTALVKDPGWLATPGSVIEVTHQDLAGGAPTNLIVMSSAREVLSDWVSLGLWGWDEES